MAIAETDIKLFASERLEDTTDGGGRITGNVIVSGQENNIFPDISRINRVYGNISLRKIFPAVDSENTDKYYGAHTIISDVPKDPAVSVTLFTTKNWDDYRTQQREYVERYLAKSGKWIGYLYDRQVVGQKSIQVWQREGVPLPDINSVWVLTQNEGLGTEYSQYVRIVRFSEKVQTFYQDGKSFKVRLVNVELSDPLIYDFVGVAPNINDISSTSTIRTTIAVDAAKYYGCRPLSQNATTGAMSVYVDSIYNQLVPSSQTEIPAVDISAGVQNGAVTVSANSTVSFTSSQTISSLIGFYLGNGCEPGSLSISVTGGSITDDGGDLKFNGTTTVGTIEYSSGLLNFNINCPTYSGTKTIIFKPAVAVIQVADTAAININTENRGYVYTINLFPLPTKGSVFVDFMAQGKWYRLYDKANGTISGIDTSYGSGTINYTSGSVILTCGALPDVGSEIIFSWAAPSSTFNRADLAISPPTIEFTLDHIGIAPNTYTVTWPTGNSLSDDGLGNLTGTGGTGTISYSTGKVKIKPTLLPLGGSSFSSSYSYGNPISKTFLHPQRNLQGKLELQLDDTNIIPKTVEIEFNTLIQDYEAYTFTQVTWIPTPPRNTWIDPLVTCKDNGSGVITKVTGSTIDYTNGFIVLLPDMTTNIPKPKFGGVPLGSTSVNYGSGIAVYTNYRYQFLGWEYIPAPAKFPIDETGVVTVKYRAEDTAQSVIGEVHSIADLTIDLTDQFIETIIPSSIRFTLGGKTYFEQNGYLYHTINNLDGSAVQAGTLDYTSGVATITNWQPGTSNTVSLQSLLTNIQAQSVDEITFRTPGAPIRPSSLYLQANTLNGTLISVTADSTGIISNAHFDGKVDYQTGVVRIRFGQWITKTTNTESEPWYNVEAIRPDGKIFSPVPIYPGTLKFNCVVYTYLPLDSSILGLETVRLPMDGKVVVYKKGDIAVVHNTKSVTCSNPLSAGTIVDVNRERLSKIEVQDAAGIIVNPTSIYTADLDAGIVTFNSPLNLSAYTQPLKIFHTVEDMALVTDVEINGKLSLNKILSHDFAKDESYVSSALIMGDMFARWTNPYSQGSWTSVWSDSMIGSAIIPKYNYNLNPIVVTNKGTIQQRWALIFTSTTDFRIIGETLGQIGTGSINTITNPSNPNNGFPYFSLASAGWGAGWSSGNVLRFNTIASNYPVSICRTVLQSSTSSQSDGFRIAIRGDIDA